MNKFKIYLSLSILGLILFFSITPAQATHLTGNASTCYKGEITNPEPGGKLYVGKTYSATVEFENNGSTTWTTAGEYKLGALDSKPAPFTSVWDPKRVALPHSVPPSNPHGSANVTFGFDVKAPSTPGSYNFFWQMLIEGVDWFGAACLARQYEVVNPPFDYTISTSVSSVTVRPGDFVSLSINLGLVSGTTKNVPLTISGLPAGGGYQLGSPGGCSPGCNNILSITTESSTPVGTYTITVTGTPSGGPNKSTTFTLRVAVPSSPSPSPSPPPSFDYSISTSLTDSKVSVTPGLFVSLAVRLRLISGTTKIVPLTVSLPTGVGLSYQFDPDTPDCAPGPSCDRILSIITESSTPAGSYTITVTGTPSGGPNKSIPFTLNVIAPAKTVTSTTLFTNNPSPAIGSKITLSGILKTSEGSPLGNKVIKIKDALSGLILKTAQTFEFGDFAFEYDITSSNPFTIYALYEGDASNQMSQSASITITPNSATQTEIYADTTVPTLGSIMTFSGFLKSSSGQPITSKVVKLVNASTGEVLKSSSDTADGFTHNTDSRGEYIIAINIDSLNKLPGFVKFEGDPSNILSSSRSVLISPQVIEPTPSPNPTPSPTPPASPTPPPAVNYSLGSGWNVIGIPLNIVTTPQRIVTDTSGVCPVIVWFDPDTLEAKFYTDPSLGVSGSNLASVQSGQGYFVYCYANAALSLQGPSQASLFSLKPSVQVITVPLLKDGILAENFLQEVLANQPGVSCPVVAKFDRVVGDWTSYHFIGTSENNFNLSSKEGYLVWCQSR